MRPNSRLSIVLLIACLWAVPWIARADETARPNVVLVMADDQGWGDTGYNGQGNGGVRVPGLVEWPVRIGKSFVSDMPCSTFDIYQTVLAATGAKAEK